MHLDTIGLVAGVLTTSAWLPQLLRTWQARSADGLSWPYLAILSSGIALWITYGVLTANAPVVIANSVTFTLVSAVVGIKASARRRARIVEMANADRPSTVHGQPAVVRCRAAGSAWTTSAA